MQLLLIISWIPPWTDGSSCLPPCFLRSFLGAQETILSPKSLICCNLRIFYHVAVSVARGLIHSITYIIRMSHTKENGNLRKPGMSPERHLPMVELCVLSSGRDRARIKKIPDKQREIWENWVLCSPDSAVTCWVAVGKSHTSVGGKSTNYPNIHL